jgi:hypothetical protein
MDHRKHQMYRRNHPAVLASWLLRCSGRPGQTVRGDIGSITWSQTEAATQRLRALVFPSRHPWQRHAFHIFHWKLSDLVKRPLQILRRHWSKSRHLTGIKIHGCLQTRHTGQHCQATLSVVTQCCPTLCACAVRDWLIATAIQILV